MRRNGSKILAGAIVIVLVFLLLNAYVLHRMRVVLAPFEESRASGYNLAGQFHEELDYIRHWQELVKENQDLKTQLSRTLVSRAAFESLQAENDFLRKSVNLKSFSRTEIPAGIFNLSLSPTGYSALANKGSDNGVTVGAIVVSAEGVLIGRVQNVFPSSSRVQLVSDPSFSVTVKVLGGSAAGIARGALSDGMLLELIVQTDQVNEGDTLVSSGNDMVPAGLVVGTVSNVQTNDTQLFKKVTIKPAATFISGNIVILQ